MKRKLVVQKETLRSLSMRDLAGAAGGTSMDIGSAEPLTVEPPRFIMQDSRVVPTSRR